jgi:hypothetical protein
MRAISEEIQRAIAERRLIEFKFFQHRLTVEPYALGVKDDQKRLVCLHLSKNPTINSIRLGSISEIKVLDEQFDRPRGDYGEKTLAGLLTSVECRISSI